MSMLATEGENPRSNMANQSQQAVLGAEEEEEEERIDLKTIQSFAHKVQHRPLEPGEEVASRPKLVIPKRGEKDFEPLQETVNLQEMMLQKSREALFNALVGVRGGGSKSMSHALYTHSPFPRMLVTRGHIHDTLGISVRRPPRFGVSASTHTELLPEEALYLLERGSLQIWIGHDASTETDHALGVGEWNEEGHGVRGAIEMSVMEGYAAFIGKEGLTWERYQAYAYLKRLGYTVQRSRRFLPPHFGLDQQEPAPQFKTWWLRIPEYLSRLISSLRRACRRGVDLMRIGLHTRQDYASLFAKLRIIPHGHDNQLPSRLSPPVSQSIYQPLEHNPYLPFFHVWKPATPWSKSKWDKGSVQGLASQKPDYYAAIIDARTVAMPTIHQLSQVFDDLPDEPKGPTQRHGPQYRSRPVQPQTPRSWTPFLAKQPVINPMGALRNGDRALVVAVNDSGNTGWVRFGRAGFAEALMI